MRSPSEQESLAGFTQSPALEVPEKEERLLGNVTGHLPGWGRGGLGRCVQPRGS